MEILSNHPIDLELVADLCAMGIKRKAPKPRDLAQWHVTNLLRSARLITKGDTRYYEFEGSPMGIMSMGRIWESAMDCYLSHYAAELDGFYVPDVESVKDGIVASLDGVMFIPGTRWIVCESKLRFSSNREIPPDHLQQIRAYCHLAETNMVYYASGHISANPPVVVAELKLVRFTQQSINECWQGIVNTKIYLETQGCHPLMCGETV